MTNWLECAECHVGCKPHEDWCSKASIGQVEVEIHRMSREAKRYLAQLPPKPASQHQTVPGTTTFTTLKKD